MLYFSLVDFGLFVFCFFCFSVRYSLVLVGTGGVSNAGRWSAPQYLRTRDRLLSCCVAFCFNITHGVEYVRLHCPVGALVHNRL